MPLHPLEPVALAAGALLLAAGTAGCSAGEELSFLVVSMDTFRADRLGAVDARGQAVTPNLDRLSEDSLVFTRAFSQANETLYSHASLFTGVYASELGELAYETFRLPHDSVTIAAQLGQAGYRTEAVVAGGHLSPHFGISAGFQRYQVMQDFASFQQTVPAALERLEVLEALDRPFLLFVHGYDTHTPYARPGPLFRQATPGYSGPMLRAARNPLTYERILWETYYPDFEPSQRSDDLGNNFISPSSFDELERYASAHPELGLALGQEDLDFLVGTYGAAARGADFFVEALLDGLEEQGLSEHTVVVILSDHGEDLLDHGHFNHRLSLHDENVHVPLLLRVPGQAPARVDEPVALVDVMPTVAALAGLRARPGRGRSLLEPSTGRAIWSESMRGDVSVRSVAGRLSLPLAQSQLAELTDAPPEGAWMTDAGGDALAWSDPLRGSLWSALCDARP